MRLLVILPKNNHLKRFFTSYVKLLASLFLSFRTNQKNVLQRESLWILFINWGTQPAHDFCCWINNEHNLGQFLPVVLDFFNFFCQTEGWDCFWQPNVLSKFSKITYRLKVSEYKEVGSFLTCPKSAKWLSILNCSVSAKWAIWESIYHQAWRS